MQPYFVIDIEAFSGHIIKEVGISSPHFTLGFSFLPPTTFTSLPTGRQNQNNWLTRNLHGITWESGTIPFTELSKLLSLFNNPNIPIYVKGLNKIQALTQYLPGVTFLNLDDISCPKYEDLLKFPGMVTCGCFSYSQAHNSIIYGNHCAQKKAQVYSSWLSFRFQNIHDE